MLLLQQTTSKIGCGGLESNQRRSAYETDLNPILPAISKTSLSIGLHYRRALPEGPGCLRADSRVTPQKARLIATCGAGIIPVEQHYVANLIATRKIGTHLSRCVASGCRKATLSNDLHSPHRRGRKCGAITLAPAVLQRRTRLVCECKRKAWNE